MIDFLMTAILLWVALIILLNVIPGLVFLIIGGRNKCK